MITPAKMRSRRVTARCALLLWLLPWLLPSLHVLGQSPEPTAASSDAPEQIAGRAVSAADGLPVPGASISIADARTNQIAASTLTGGDGSFTLPAVPPGKYRLEGTKRGYLPSAFEQHEQFFTGVVTGAGLPTGSLTLRLAPAALLTGRVTDVAGEPVRGAAIALYGENHDTGVAKIIPLQSAQTDDQGSYEIAGLAPGTYFLSAQATPWYAVHPPSRSAGNEIASVDDVDPALDVAYPLTFYANATSSDEALPIPVKGGETLTIDLQLTPQPAVRLSIHPAIGLKMQLAPQLQVPVFEGYESAPVEVQGTGSGIEMVGIAPGKYRYLDSGQTMPGGTAGDSGGGAASSLIDLTRSADLSAFAASEPGALHVVLKDVTGAKLPALVLIALRGAETGFSTGQVANQQAEADFSGLPPGDYQFLINGEGHPYHIVRATSEGRRLGRAVPVTSGSTTALTLYIAATTVKLEGRVKRGGTASGAASEAMGGAMVVLVPLGRTSDPDLVRRDQSDMDGSFVLADIVPGRYAVIAIDDGWKLDWGRKDILSRYLPRGIPVTITQEQGSVALPVEVPLQTR